jgi:hypothetical protein
MNMKKLVLPVMIVISLALAVAGGRGSSAQEKQNKYSLRVPGGLAFSEFRGYESWQVISISDSGTGILAVIVGNPATIAAYQAGAPDNGKPFPDGSKMAKIHYTPKKLETFPSSTVPATEHDVDFMVKDSKRFADSGGWGWAAFDYDAASDTFKPATTADDPPQSHDAKCGFVCHTVVKSRDYVFTQYAHR